MFKDKVIFIMLFQPFNIIFYQIVFHLRFPLTPNTLFKMWCNYDCGPGIWNTDSENIVPSITILKSWKSIGKYILLGQVPLKIIPVKQEIHKSVTAQEPDGRENADSVLEFSMTTSHLHLAAVYCLVHWSIWCWTKPRVNKVIYNDQPSEWKRWWINQNSFRQQT